MTSADSHSLPGRASRPLRAARAVFVVALIAGLAYSVRSQWHTVGADFRELPPWDAAIALTFCLIAVGCSLLAWRAMLTTLGSPLPLVAAVHIFTVSQVGKYVPGSIWPVVTQMELGRGFRVPRLRMATAFLLTLLSGVVLSIAIGGLLAFSSPGWGRAYAALPLCVALLHPRILLPLSGILSRVLRREPVTSPPTVEGVQHVAAWMVLQWICLGATTTVLIHGLGESVSLPAAIGATALSWAVGLMVIVVPAGAGVREGVFTLLLAPMIGSAHALSVALLGRLALTLADAAFAVVGLLLTRRARRHRAVDEPTRPA